MGTAKLWGLTSGILYLAGVYALFDHRGIAPLLICAGVLTLCLAFWHARGDDGGGGWDDDDDGDPPIDWDRFDRLRRTWDRPRIGV